MPDEEIVKVQAVGYGTNYSLMSTGARYDFCLLVNIRFGLCRVVGYHLDIVMLVSERDGGPAKTYVQDVDSEG